VADTPSNSFAKYWILFLTCTLSLTLDQWTKHQVHNHFRWGESLNLIHPVFALTYVRNSGAAFGLLHRAPSWFRDPFFIIVPVVALFVIFFLFIRLSERQKWTAGALSLILGGAVGNLIDRLRFGFVIDFLDVHWKEFYHWPAFNVADSCIVVGVGILFVQSFFEGQTSVEAPEVKENAKQA
jgi:signal peptidase II